MNLSRATMMIFIYFTIFVKCCCFIFYLRLDFVLVARVWGTFHILCVENYWQTIRLSQVLLTMHGWNVDLDRSSN